MFVTLQTSILVCSLVFVGAALDELSEYKIAGSGFYDYNYDFTTDGNIRSIESPTPVKNLGEEIAEILSPQRENVNSWFGSEELANTILWDRLHNVYNYDNSICSLDIAWICETTKNTLLLKSESILSSDERQDVLTILENVIQGQVNGSYRQCAERFRALRNFRSHLDCALGPEITTEHLKRITSYSLSSVLCWDALHDLWSNITTVINSRDIPCSSHEVYMDLINIAQVTTQRYKYETWDTPEDEAQRKLKEQLTNTLSTHTTSAYINHIICPEQTGVTDCQTLVVIISQTVCETLSLSIVNQIIELLKTGSTEHPPTKPNEMATLMNIQSQLIDVTQTLSGLVTRSVYEPPDIALNMLDYYLSIVDNTIGENAVHVWEKMPHSRAAQQFSTVLENNDKYVGAISDLIFSTMTDLNSTTVNKTSLTLQLTRVSEKEKIGFNFTDVEIETSLNGSYVDDDMKVYAFHYKSWSDILGEGVSNNISKSSKKIFVGKGGIISLTANSNKTKVSLPVSYKMKFGSPIDIDDGSSSVLQYRCLSCEYLNVTNGQWETEGCSARKVNDREVTCHCNHTTNFAAFMSPISIEMNMTDAQYKAKQIVSYVGSGISVIALAISLVIFNIVRSTIHNDRLKAHINLTFALFFVHLTQLVTYFAEANQVACLVTTMVTHFFLLSSFFWMLIEGIFLYLYVVQVFVHSNIEYIRWVFFSGWAIPALIVTISAGIGIPRGIYIDTTTYECEPHQMMYPHMEDDRTCWLSIESGMGWTFIAPAVVIIFINCIILGKVVQVLAKVSVRSQTMKSFRPTTTPSRKKAEFNAATRSVKLGEAASNDYGTTNNGCSFAQQSESSKNDIHGQSPSRFDSRVPSKAYMYNQAQQRSNRNPSPSKGGHFVSDVKAAVKGALVLLPILGIPWICGMLAGTSYALLMIFVIMNSTQGLAILVVYCILNGEVRRALQRHIQLIKLQSSTGGRSRTSSTSSLRSLNDKMFRNWKRGSTTSVTQVAK